MNSASGRAASRRKHLFLYVLVIAVGALGTMYVSRGEAHAATATAYSAEVEGDGLAINVVDARLPLVGPSISVSPWAAGSQLSTIGESIAFAGAPYLGPAVTPLYGTAQGLATNIGSNAASEVLGIIQGVVPLPLPPVNLPTLPIAGFKLPALPALPGYVQSSFPVARSNHVAAGAYNLSASSAARSNKADLLAGGNAGSAAGVAKVFASSTLKADRDGGYTGTATAGVSGLTIGGTIDIGEVSSTMTLKAAPSRAPVIHQSSNFGSITVGGIRVAVTPTGINVVGKTLSTPAAASQLVDKILGAAGLRMKFLPAHVSHVEGTKQIAGATSGALLISITKNVPDEGKVTVNLTMGQVSIGGPVQQGVGIGSGTSTSGGATRSSGSGGSTTAPGGSMATSGSAGAGTTPPDLGSTSSAAGSGPAPAVATGGSTPRGAIREVGRIGPSLESIYLMLVLAGVAVAGGGLLVGQLGIRLRLRSLVSR